MTTSEQTQQIETDTSRATKANTDASTKSAKLYYGQCIRTTAGQAQVHEPGNRRTPVGGHRPGSHSATVAKAEDTSATEAVIPNIPIKCSLYYAPGRTNGRPIDGDNLRRTLAAW